MEPLSNKKKVLEVKPLNLLERAYLPALLAVWLHHETLF
jgi:NADH-quinone oxidoreductase subunit I